MPTMTANRRSDRRTIRPAHGTARLMVRINGVVYSLMRVPTDPDAALQAFRLRKQDGTCYVVARTHHGPVCDCPDFVFHRDGIDAGGCKHVKGLVAVGLMPSR